MKGKILLYNSNDIKIGETFIRRARQLVKQQRAVWVDDDQRAIRFAPDMENMDAVAAYSVEKSQIPIDLNVIPDDDSRLNSMIEKRLSRRKWFIVHSITLIPGLIFLMIFSAIISEAVIKFAWDYFNIYIYNAITIFSIFSSVWVIVYLGHVYLYATNKHARERITMELSAECTIHKANVN